MTGRIVALYYNPWRLAAIERPSQIKNPLALYRYAVWYKANPRGASYMRNLLARRFPEAVWIDIAEHADWRSRIMDADTVLLLYPDALGLGFSSLEQQIISNKRIWAGVRVLNGRGREFLLNTITRRGLQLRRVLEWTMLPEILFLLVFMLMTPLYLILDLFRGRI